MNAFSYEVHEGGAVSRGGLPCCSINIRDESLSLVGLRDTDVRDLLRVVTGLHYADVLSSRASTGARDPEPLPSWQRTISVTIDVENPERWRVAVPRLLDCLSFLTSDHWDVRFEGCARPLGDQPLHIRGTRSGTTIALFSGGLDSAAGLFLETIRGKDVLPLSVHGVAVRGSMQKGVLREVEKRVRKRIDWLRLGVSASGLPKGKTELSQRTRGLLFLGVAAAAASAGNIGRVVAYEPGPGAINLPFTAAQVGSMNTRAMHPRTLRLLWELLGCVLDRPPVLELPFLKMTKGDVCRDLKEKNALEPLLDVTQSCDEGERGKKDTVEHCGACTSCLFRRIAIHAACASEPIGRYRDHVTSKRGPYDIEAVRLHALRVDRIQDERSLRFQFPEVAAVEPHLSLSDLLQLMKRQSKETLAFLARPLALSPRPQPVASAEVNGGLFQNRR